MRARALALGMVLGGIVGIPSAAAKEAQEKLPMPGTAMTAAQVESFARLAMDGIVRPYPYKPGHVLIGDESLRPPRDAHPVFYGCFDWHSAVHSHWALVRLLRLYPQVPIAATIRKQLDGRFTAEKLQKEADFFAPKHNRAFERTYGWAWALQLARELRTFDDPDAKRWAKHFAPLEKVLVELTKAFLPRMHWPLRSGEHRDTAFALAFMHDYARDAGDDALRDLITTTAKKWYGRDVKYPIAYEPSGHDFFSAGLNEADLMRRILDGKAYHAWLDGFWPGLAKGKLGAWHAPVEVSDLEDGKLVHLVGLNLTRAWTLRGIASSFPGDDPRHAVLTLRAAVHAKAGLEKVFSGSYAGEHWLGSFAVYMLTDAGITARSGK